MLIRLKPDANAKAFIAKNSTKEGFIQEGYKALVQLKTYKEYKNENPNFTSQYILLNIIGLFLGLFLVNVVIGTLGTYWLQIRKRTEDIGIMRSFGQVLWLQFALRVGFANGLNEIKTGQESDWVTSFWPHFFVVCGVQYLVLLAIVTLGIIVPSLIAMYTKPVNALRHE